MRDLDKALADISEIKSQMARGQDFRAYGPAALAATSALAVLAGLAQLLIIRQPADPLPYVALWGATAVLAAALIGGETAARSRRVHSGLAQEMLLAAIEHFLPAAMAGGLITLVLFRAAPESLWMLPGLWQIVLSLGVFASSRFLPRAVFWIGAWYMTSGLGCLLLARGAHAFSPLAMAAPFAIGQLAAAAIIHRIQRRP